MSYVLMRQSAHSQLHSVFWRQSWPLPPWTSPPIDRFFGHPRGLSTLFFTEMWERFSYYGMRALLILFMTAPIAAGGLGFDTALAGAVYGLYTSMVYMTSLPGGWIADRIIGQRRAVLYGGILIACGHFCMAFPSLRTFYTGLVLIVVGTGLLKGNVSVIVGRLYGPDDKRRDAGFSIFYMGINLGAFIAPLICGYLGQKRELAFGVRRRRLRHGDRRRAVRAWRQVSRRGRSASGARPRHRGRRALRDGVCVCGAAPRSPRSRVLRRRCTPGSCRSRAKDIADAAGFLLLGITVLFFVWMFFVGDWTPAERRRLYAIAASFLAATVFWSEFEQAGSTLNLFGDRATRTSIFGWQFPSSYFQSLQPLFIITLRAGVCVDLAAARTTRAVEPGEVRHGARCLSAPASRCSSSPRNWPRPA